MCGRYTLTGPLQIRDEFAEYAFEEFSEYRLPRFNIAPTQRVLGVRNDGRNRVEAMTWSLHGRINTRAESVIARRPARRCILFADGFYEWHARRPKYFTMRDASLFAFAGLWEPQADANQGCTIITCAPNELVAPVHTRMPVILPHDRIGLWLSEERLPNDAVDALLRPYAASAMQVRAVSQRLNDARYDAPDALVDDDPQPPLFAL